MSPVMVLAIPVFVPATVTAVLTEHVLRLLKPRPATENLIHGTNE